MSSRKFFTDTSLFLWNLRRPAKNQASVRQLAECCWVSGRDLPPSVASSLQDMIDHAGARLTVIRKSVDDRAIVDLEFALDASGGELTFRVSIDRSALFGLLENWAAEMLGEDAQDTSLFTCVRDARR